MSAAPALRPYLPADAARCAAIFRASIGALAIEDYSADQCEAWAARADDSAAFGKGLAQSLTLIATIEGANVGFASLKGVDVLDMLFVDPAHARRGVGTTLIDALTRIAAARGADRLSAEVSDTAKPLFQRRGFVAQRRNLVAKGDQWLGNTTMTLALPKPAAAPTTRH
jgi:putative acetyltransferase